MINVGSPDLFDLRGILAVGAGEAANPYDVPVQRALRLTGARDVPPPGTAAGANLGVSGTYEETISGLAFGPVVVRGTFSVTPETDKALFEEP